MENKWVKIFETSNPIQSQIILAMLRDNEIEAHEINKIDSSYTVFGMAEIYCMPEDVEKAMSLIMNNA